MKPGLIKYPAAVLDASAICAVIRESFMEENNDNNILSFLWQRRCYLSSINSFEVESLIDELFREESLELSWSMIKRLLIQDYHLAIREVTIEDARWMVARASGSHLSIEGLSCLALGHRLGLPVITADPELMQESWISREVEVILI